MNGVDYSHAAMIPGPVRRRGVADGLARQREVGVDIVSHDIPLAKIVGAVMRAKPSAVSFEASNPRHAHEQTVWREVDVPDDKVLIPGVIDSTTNFIEHPELVAQRIATFAGIVGRERVLAGVDCGFGTFAGYGKMDPDICYAKLRALAEGAAIASSRLWG